MSEKTALQEWIRQRVDEVQEKYTTYDALTEFGIELIDNLTDLQISCIYPQHGVDANPSSRFYGGPGKESRFWCYKCKKMARSIDIYSQFKGLSFMEGLSKLESRLSIVPPKLKETSFETRKEKVRTIPQRLKFLEEKLIRSRDKIPFIELIKYFRVLDAVRWDFEKEGKFDNSMFEILDKVESRVNESLEMATLVSSI